MALFVHVVLVLISIYLTAAYVMGKPGNANQSASAITVQHVVRRADEDPADFSWIERWAAIGDSFTAGIGSGDLYSDEEDDVKCSRYDHSYPVIINKALGPSVQDFQYLACSGDRSGQIYEQISKIKKNVNMVMMTAGGNDLCLVSIIVSTLRKTTAD